MSGGALNVAFAEIEGRHLLAVVDEFITLLDGPRDGDDDALNRLTPNPYPNDRDAAGEYRRSTREELLDQRLVDALAVRTALDCFEAEQTADVTTAVTVPRSELDAWLRTLSAIRLVLASRLGIDKDDAHDPDDVRFGTYDWLGYRLELLVQLADQHDAR